LNICEFKKWYTQWIWHRDNYKEFMNVGKSRAALNSETIICDESDDENIEIFEPITDVRDDSDGENVQNLDNLECMKHNNNLDEMMNNIAADFLDIPNCTKFTKISVIFKLYNLKAKNEWSDKSYTSLLKFLGDMFLDNNELSDLTYKIKKLLCPLSMEVEIIHACPNDCILYQKEYSDMNKYLKCKASRYKLKDEQASMR
jgi:hypothetical protein